MKALKNCLLLFRANGLWNIYYLCFFLCVSFHSILASIISLFCSYLFFTLLKISTRFAPHFNPNQNQLEIHVLCELIISGFLFYLLLVYSLSIRMGDDDSLFFVAVAVVSFFCTLWIETPKKNRHFLPYESYVYA